MNHNLNILRYWKVFRIHSCASKIEDSLKRRNIAYTSFLFYPYYLIYGGIKYIKAMCKKNKTMPDESKVSGLAIVAICKNEGEYILEWLAFHKLIGVNHVILYDNDSSDDMINLVQSHFSKDFVTILPIHGQKNNFLPIIMQLLIMLINLNI